MRRSRSFRLLVPAAVTAAVVFVPSTAFAGTGDDPAGGLGSAAQGAVESVVPSTGSSSDATDGAGDATLPIDPTTGLPIQFPPGLGGAIPGIPGTPGESPDPGTQLTPTALRQLFIQALAPLGITPACVNGVFDGFEGVVTALTAQGPEQLQDLIDALTAGLTDPSSFDPSSLGNGALANALKGLAATLQDECMPALPGAGGGGGPVVHPPTDGYGYDEGYEPHDNSGGYQAPAPVAAAPVAAPGAYLGYAPTGGDPEEASSSVPLAALGGIVLLSAVGATTYQVSIRGARSRG